MVFNTQVNGVPCKCKVTHWAPARPAIIRADPGDSHPPEPAEFEFELLDRKGYRAKWLDRYINDGVSERLYEEFCLESDAEASGLVRHGA